MAHHRLTRSGLVFRSIQAVERSGLRVKLVLRIAFALIALSAVGLFGWFGSGLISPVNAQDVTYFRIATGRPGSQSFDIAGDISKAISNPVVGTECDPTENCGVPGVIGMAQTTDGAQESLKLLGDGQVDGAIVQADMAALAAAGKGPFKAAGANASLRAIATVGDATLQVIVSDKSPVQGYADLKGRKIAVTGIEADSQASVTQILTQLGIFDKKTKPIAVSLADGVDQLVNGKVDALALVDRRNLPEVMGITDHMGVRLVPVTAADLAKIGSERHDYILAHLPVGTDGSSVPVDTLIVPILFVVTEKTPNNTAYELARTLVVPKKGAKTTANPAVSSPDFHIESTVVPLHPGVEQPMQTTN